MLKQLKKILFLILISVFTGNSFAQKISISAGYSLNDFYAGKNDSAYFIKSLLNNEVTYFPETGYAELPFVACYVLLPHHAKITRIIMTGGTSEICTGSFPMLSIPDFQSYGENVHFESPELFAGYLVNRIYICPFRYLPESNELLFHSKISFDILYQTEPLPVILEPSAEKIKQAREFISMKVINPEDADKIIPLEEKLDYSGLDFFKNETDSLKSEIKETRKLKSTTEPFFIKQLR